VNGPFFVFGAGAKRQQQQPNSKATESFHGISLFDSEDKLSKICKCFVMSIQRWILEFVCRLRFAFAGTNFVKRPFFITRSLTL
jgi:hypothetical protein